jgi:acyl-CoA synthetase (NDP forming)
LDSQLKKPFARHTKILCPGSRSKQPDAKIDGILIAKDVDGSTAENGREGHSDTLEVIIGAVRDPEFGYAIMFGLGGIFVEIARDVTFRVTPVTREDALEMMSEIKAAHMLDGVRGKEPEIRTHLQTS